MAHDQPAFLRRLARRLTAAGDEVFVHASRTGSLDVRVLDLPPGAHLLGEQRQVHWGGYSMVDTALYLLEEAMAAGPFDRYVLLSGSHYPLASAFDLRHFFDRHAAREFLSCVPLSDPRAVRKVNRFRHPVIERGLANRGVRNMHLRLWNDKVLSRERFAMDYLHEIAPLEPHVGGAWFALGHPAAADLLRALQPDGPIAGYFRRTAHPLEAAFHTVLASSPWANALADDLTYERWAPRLASPLKLDDDALAELIGSLRTEGHNPFGRVSLFARKFGEADGVQLDRIDAELHDSGWLHAAAAV